LPNENSVLLELTVVETTFSLQPKHLSSYTITGGRMLKKAVSKAAGHYYSIKGWLG